MGDVLAVVAAYLIGNLSFGYLVGRLQKIDIRDYGSGNIGATNVLRTLGVWPALLTLVLDVGKGMAAVFLARYLGQNLWTPVLAGILAIVGHNWPFVLRFKGGRGVATTLGVLLAPDAARSHSCRRRLAAPRVSYSLYFRRLYWRGHGPSPCRLAIRAANPTCVRVLCLGNP